MKIQTKFSSKQEYLNYYKRVKDLSKQPLARVSGLVSLTILTVAFFGMFAILPTFKTIAQLNREIDDAKTVNVKLQAKIQALDKAEDVYNQVGKEINLVNQLLPANNEFERLAWQINWLAQNKNLEINSMTFGEFGIKSQQASKEELLTVEVDLGLSGSYLQIKEFLQTVTKVDRLIEIKQLSLSSKKLTKEAGVVTASLKLRAYFSPEQIERQAGK